MHTEHEALHFLKDHICSKFNLFSSFTYRNRCKQPFRDIGNNDPNEEDNSLQPCVLEDEGKDEESNTQEHSHSSDEVDEVLDLHGNWSFPPFQSRSQAGNTAHHSAIPSANDNATGSAWKRDGF